MTGKKMGPENRKIDWRLGVIEFSFFAAIIDASAVEMVFLSALESSAHFKVGKNGVIGQEAWPPRVIRGEGEG